MACTPPATIKEALCRGCQWRSVRADVVAPMSMTTEEEAVPEATAMQAKGVAQQAVTVERRREIDVVVAEYQGP